MPDSVRQPVQQSFRKKLAGELQKNEAQWL